MITKFRRKFSVALQGHKVKMKCKLHYNYNCCSSRRTLNAMKRPQLSSRIVLFMVPLVAAFVVSLVVFSSQVVICDKHNVKDPNAATADYLSVSAAIVTREDGQNHHEQQRQAAFNGDSGIGAEFATSEQSETSVGFGASTKRSPSFEADQEARVVASRWQTEVFLPCKILDLDEEQTVSWIRKRDSLVLTIDKLKLIDDPRFQLTQSQQDWTLLLLQPSSSDAGFYECQVSSMEPKLSRLVELRMIEANSRISNLSSLYMKHNEQLNLTCTIESPQRTNFVYWYKNKEPVHFDNLRPANKDEQATTVDPYIRRASRSAPAVPLLLSSRDRSDKLSSTSYRRPTAATKASGRGASKKTAHEDEQEEDDDDRHYEEEEEGESESEISASQQETSRRNKNGRLNNNSNNNNNNNNNNNSNKSGGVGRRGNEDNNDANAVKLVRSSSSFIIKQVQANDTANYTCLPSNAKPSHISVIVIENGAQSQPEKRSLQAVDGACSHRSLLKEIYLLGQLIKLKLIAIVPNQLNLALLFGSHNDSPRLLIDSERYPDEEQSILNQLLKLIGNQEFHRFLIPIASMMFYLRGP